MCTNSAGVWPCKHCLTHTCKLNPLLSPVVPYKSRVAKPRRATQHLTTRRWVEPGEQQAIGHIPCASPDTARACWPANHAARAAPLTGHVSVAHARCQGMHTLNTGKPPQQASQPVIKHEPFNCCCLPGLMHATGQPQHQLQARQASEHERVQPCVAAAVRSCTDQVCWTGKSEHSRFFCCHALRTSSLPDEFQDATQWCKVVTLFVSIHNPAAHRQAPVLVAA